MLRVLEKRLHREPLFRRTSRRAYQRGFTLVEISMALGIMTITLIPLLGVMALGVGQVASNIDNNQAVNISQQVFLERGR